MVAWLMTGCRRAALIKAGQLEFALPGKKEAKK